MSEDDDQVGYGKPPKHSRFRKGRSGNPKGRPKSARNFSTLMRREFGERIIVTEGGRRRSLSKAEALVKRLTTDALSGKPGAQKMLLAYWLGLEADTEARGADQVGSTSIDAADRQALEAFKRSLLEEIKPSGASRPKRRVAPRRAPQTPTNTITESEGTDDDAGN